MTILKPTVDRILKSLPVGYYLNHQINIELGDDDKTYIDIMNDKIHIGYLKVKELADKFENEELVEEDVRSLLYHEISHALLTPKNLRMTRQMNIFEDERIESLLRDYYMKVDFKEFVKRFNDYHGEDPQSGDEFYYQIVRYRVGPQDLVNEVHELIMKYRNISSVKDDDTYYYEWQVQDFYKKVLDRWQKQEEEKRQQQNQQQSNSNEQSSETENDSNVQTSASESDDNAQAATQDVEDQLDEEASNPSQLVKDVCEKYNDSTVESGIDKLLASLKTTEKSNGSAINAYSGVFNPRSVVRQDYKWFVQQNRLGHVKAYSKFKLNLFIDCSGSFEDNDLAVNRLLKALHRFEKQNKDFSFDLISCGVGQKIRNKNDRVQKSYDGTLITWKIAEQFKQVQEAGAQNVNIVLYDGDCVYSANSKEQHSWWRALKTFDSSNCVLIVDKSNEQYTSKVISTAKVIVSNDYVNQLTRNVMTALTLFCK